MSDALQGAARTFDVSAPKYGSIRDLRNGNFAWFNRSIMEMKLGWKANLAYMGLVSFANGNTQACFPSKNTLADALGVSKSTIFRGLQNLKSAGVIDIIERKTAAGFLSNEYILLPIPLVPVGDMGSACGTLGVVSVGHGVVSVGDNNKKKEQEEKEQERKTVSQTENFTLPEWISPQVWESFEQMRISNRWKLTPQARRNIVNKLLHLRGQGYNPDLLLNEAITRCWRGIFATEDARDVTRAPNKPKTSYELEEEQMREERQRAILEAGSR